MRVPLVVAPGGPLGDGRHLSGLRLDPVQVQAEEVSDVTEPTRGPLVVVDTETNGLDVERHQAVEVAWWNLDTGQRGDFIPAHSVPDVLYVASVKALQINRYVDRIAERVPWNHVTEQDVRQLHEVLTGATLVGSNVQFDAAMLSKLFDKHTLPDADAAPWHYRHWELGPYAAGVLCLDHIPGLAELAERFGVATPDHSAAGDVTATGEVFLALREIAAEREAE